MPETTLCLQGMETAKKKVSLPLVGQQAERAFTPFAKKKKMPAEKAYYAAESDVRYVDFLLSEESATITNVTQTDILTDAGVPLRSVFFKRYFFCIFYQVRAMVLQCHRIWMVNCAHASAFQKKNGERCEPAKRKKGISHCTTHLL